MRSTIKIFGIIALVAVIGFSMAACPGGGGPEKEDEKPETGLYMGIIGFNDNITSLPIQGFRSWLCESFINGLTMKPGTGLYYAVDNAIDMLQSATLPDDLVNVSIVTFTDGLDNVSIDLNTKYNSRDAYRDAVKNRIGTTKIKNLNIDAYSIGVRGGDVTDTAAFRAGLQALASNPNNTFEVSSMAEVNRTFGDIARSLSNVSQSHSLKLKITGGYDDGTRIRFTFDGVTDAADSDFYIEGIYKRSGTNRSLQNIVYQGLGSTSGTTVNGVVTDTVYVTFTFDNVSDSSGDRVDTSITKQWEYITNLSQWQRNSEFGQTGDTEIIIADRKSAVIMLVLDCTSSLDAGGANGFEQMKNAAYNFITVLNYYNQL
jgi:hypothetical protein